MHLGKKIIFYTVVMVVFLSSFSGCILKDLLFGTSFSLKSYEVCDDDGFAGLSSVFSATGTVTVKLFDPDGSLLDSDLFLSGNNDAVFHLVSYKETVAPGQYVLRAYDKNDKKIFEQTLSFKGPDLSVMSCSQKWWRSWRDSYSLIGLTMEVRNSGDTPAYPYALELTVDSKTYPGLVLPVVILPNEIKNIDCSIYVDSAPKNNTFFASLNDVLGNTLASDSFSITMKNNVPTKEFKWTYGDDRNPWLKVPYPEFLFDYYTGINRTLEEDYSLYVFDPYDDSYVDLVVDQLMFVCGEESDVGKINFVASFVQSLEYKKDSPTNDSFEYPRYPVETLFNDDKGGGDCEDKAILTASILDQMGYDVALFRFPNHMAVGVELIETLPEYEHYTGNYYFLETTTLGKPLGFIPYGYKSLSNLTVYPISSRPLLFHNWKNNSLTIFTNTELGDFVKITLIVENLGSTTAENVLVKGGFYTEYNQELNAETDIISSLKPMAKEEITLTVDIPKGLTTWFKTKIYLDNKVVDEQESASSFP
jgi:hypothetical protein